MQATSCAARCRVLQPPMRGAGTDTRPCCDQHIAVLVPTRRGATTSAAATATVGQKATTIYVDGCNRWLPMLQPRPRHCGDTHTGDATTARRSATTGKFFCWIRLRFLLESTNFFCFNRLLDFLLLKFVLLKSMLIFAVTGFVFCWNRLIFCFNVLLDFFGAEFCFLEPMLIFLLEPASFLLQPCIGVFG